MFEWVQWGALVRNIPKIRNPVLSKESLPPSTHTLPPNMTIRGGREYYLHSPQPEVVGQRKKKASQPANQPDRQDRTQDRRDKT